MFDSIFGKKNKSKNDYGKKDESIFHKGLKFIAEKADGVADAAKSVANVSGTIASGAGVLAGGAAAIGLEPVAAGLAGVAAGAKAVQGVSTLASKGVRMAGAGAKGVLAGEAAIDKARRGDFMGALKSGEKAGAEFKKAGTEGSGLRKDIERRKKK
jgi:hypothetical protein